MKLNPNYSYEFNCILNENYNENDQIKNFASLITDKDRFLAILPFLEKNVELIQKTLGFNLNNLYNFYIVRSEKFKSFSLPISIEYSIFPEEMLLFLLKEILKVSINLRFPDEMIRDQYINSFIEYIIENGDFGNLDLIKYIKNLNEESKNLFENYESKKLDFKQKTLKQHLENLYN